MKNTILFIIIFILILLIGFEGNIILKQKSDIAKLQEMNMQFGKQNNDLQVENNEGEKELAPQPVSEKKSIEMTKEKAFPIDHIGSFTGDDYKKKLDNGVEVEIIITDKEKSEAELRFSNYELTDNPYSFRGAEYHTNLFQDEMSLIDFSFVGLDTNEIYFKDASGHEVMPQHYLVKGTHLINIGELLKGLLADKFPNERFPQINVTFYPSFIRIEEENYCCDSLYDINNPEREQYRKVFFVDRKTYNLLKEEKVNRR